MEGNQRRTNILTQKGCKNTKSRIAVIDVLEDANTPLSAEDIFMSIKQTGNTTNLSTVYRTLELLETKSLISKNIMGDGRARYTLTGEGHRHHLICTNCHKMIPLDVCPLKSIEKDVCTKTNFEITGHRLELYGVCPECKKPE